jgi:hypothetical protein
MPNPETLLRAAGVVKVVEQTWRLDSQGPTGNSSARTGERPRIEPGAVRQVREGEAWFMARGRYEHLMGGPDPDQRRLPGTSPRDGGAGAVLAAG